MSTIGVLQQLQREVGSRRAGSAGERRAQDWLTAECNKLGLHVELDTFTFIGSELYRPLLQLLLATVITAAIGLSFSGQPLAGTVLFATSFTYMSVFHKRIDVRLAPETRRFRMAQLRQDDDPVETPEAP